MHAIAPYIAPLSIDAPPPAPQRNMIDKISARQVAHKMSRQEKKILKRPDKLKENRRENRDEEDEEHKAEKKARKMEYIVVENLQ
jgi:hypothetical protein